MLVGVRGTGPVDRAFEEDLTRCARAGFGGVVLFDRDAVTGAPRNVESPEQVSRLTEAVRGALGPAAVIAVDQEGGRVARLREDRGFAPLPAARELARLTEEERRRVLLASAQELAALGVTLNFAPCVDIGQGCPVIGPLGRSFGDDPETVTARARDVVWAHARAGVTACLKHFPGHGPAREDSHADLPDISGVWDPGRDLVPYRELAGLAGVAVMTGHLRCRELDAEYPASVSPAATALLRGALGFRGEIITDSIDMGALRSRWCLADAIALAVEAGADRIVHACNSPLGETVEDVACAVSRVAAAGTALHAAACARCASTGA